MDRISELIAVIIGTALAVFCLTAMLLCSFDWLALIGFIVGFIVTAFIIFICAIENSEYYENEEVEA